jgi:hypothetical protein
MALRLPKSPERRSQRRIAVRELSESPGRLARIGTFIGSVLGRLQKSVSTLLSQSSSLSSDQFKTNMYNTEPELSQSGGGHNISRSWKADLNAYCYPELRALTFTTDDDLKRAIKLIWSKEELYGLPREPAGIRTLVVPADALRFFEGLSFAVYPVISASELSTEAKRKLRVEQGHH